MSPDDKGHNTVSSIVLLSGFPSYQVCPTVFSVIEMMTLQDNKAPVPSPFSRYSRRVPRAYSPSRKDRNEAGQDSLQQEQKAGWLPFHLHTESRKGEQEASRQG